MINVGDIKFIGINTARRSKSDTVTFEIGLGVVVPAEGNAFSPRAMGEKEEEKAKSKNG
jgi:hypothetical protein